LNARQGIVKTEFFNQMKNPFIVGSWVRGEHFFGRKKIISEILESAQNSFWVAGTRRLGKTSLLRQLELLTTESPYSERFISLFWDLEGSTDLDGLTTSLLESLEDTAERFESIGIPFDALEEMNVFEILRILKRQSKQHHRTLLILCDETEELINIAGKSPDVLPKLRRVLLQGESIRAVITATKQLHKLEQEFIPNTSPFLHGFIPPLYLSHLDDQEAEQLIGLGNFESHLIEAIKDKTGNHPFLVQLLCKRLFETENFAGIIEEITTDQMVSHFFEIDFNYLLETEKKIIWYILNDDNLSVPELQQRCNIPVEKLIHFVYSLRNLGYLKQTNSHFRISNFFFRNWLVREKERLFDKIITENLPPLKPPKVVPKQDLQIGKIISHYQIIQEIGRGGMGIVYQAKDLKLERLVALKVLLPEIVENESVINRFHREAKAASSLNHLNITTIYEFDEVNGIHFICMEFIPGQTLTEKLKIGTLSLPKTLNYALQIGEGLAHAHQKKIIHRDIKPSNIKITPDGVVKIMDFGIAKLLDQPGDTRTGVTLGTLIYMSPEQAGHGEIDQRSDIFSYGVVLYEMLTGQLPFSGEYELAILYSILNEKPSPPSRINAALPATIDEIVFKALEKLKEKRFHHITDLLIELKKLTISG